MSDEQTLKEKTKELEFKKDKLQKLQSNLRKMKKLEGKVLEFKDKKEADFILFDLNNA